MAFGWAQKRQITFIAIIALVLGTLLAGGVVLWTYEEPTCSDGEQNQNEVGPDCGGPCTLLCDSQVQEPNVLWERVFTVTPDRHSVVAFVENPNRIAQAKAVPYRFRIFSKDNVMMKEVTGTTYIPPQQQFAIFEGRIDLPEAPSRVTFEFTESDISWYRAPEERRNDRVEIVEKTQRNLKTEPKVTATVRNNSLRKLGTVEAVAVIYDEAGNAVGASRSFVDNIDRDEDRTVAFTWPQAFRVKTTQCKQPSDVMMVLDRSGSMNDDNEDPPQPLTNVKEAARSFLGMLSNKDKVGIVSFATDATAEQQLESATSTIRDAIGGIEIKKPEHEQHTNIAAGIEKAHNELTSDRHADDAHGAIVLLTDGIASRPQKAGVEGYAKRMATSTANAVRADDLDLFVIGLGDGAEGTFLEKLAKNENRYFFAPGTKDLNSIYQDIATAICKQGPARTTIYTRIMPDG